MQYFCKDLLLIWFCLLTFFVSTGVGHDFRRNDYVTNRFVWTWYEKYFPSWNWKPQSLAFWSIYQSWKPLLKKPKTTTQYRRSGWWLSNQWYKILYLKQKRTKHAIFIKINVRFWQLFHSALVVFSFNPFLKYSFWAFLEKLSLSFNFAIWK